jgi:hypothetical protein
MAWKFVGQGYDARITNFFNERGDEIDGPEGAIRIFARLPDGQWLASLVCSPDEIVELPTLLRREE